jgi:hypothetical protein
VRNGARLESEPFPESIDRRSFSSTDEYLAFLEHRRVDYVIVYDAYDARYRTNEHHLLREIAAANGGGGCISLATAGPGYEVYRVISAPAC